MIEIAALVVTVVGVTATIVGVIYQIRKRGEPPSEFRQLPKPSAEPLLLAAATEVPVETVLANVLSRYIFISPAGKFDTGIFSKVTSRVFLDLFSAATMQHDCSALAAVLVSHIKKRFGSHDLPFECLAVPKEGNVVLGAECARKLNICFIVVRTGKAIKFGYPIEGIVTTGARALLVDDVLSDGGLIKQCALLLRSNGISVNHSVFLVERADCNANSALKSANLDKSSVSVITDKLLLELARSS